MSPTRVMPLTVPLIWVGLNVANNLWWLWTLGVAAIVAGAGGLLANLSGWALAWSVVLGVGLFLFVVIAALASRGQAEVTATHGRP